MGFMMRAVILLYFLFILTGCNKAIVPANGNLSQSLNQLMVELGVDQKHLNQNIAQRITSEHPSLIPDLLLLQASMAVANDKLEIARQSVAQLMQMNGLSDEQLGFMYLMKAMTHYNVGQVTDLDESLAQAISRLSTTNDPMLLFWLETHKLLIAAYRENDTMYNHSVSYVLPRLDKAPHNLLGQLMLNMVAIGLTTGQRYNEAINVENIKVKRDEALGNIKGLSDSYYNLGNIYRKLLQPELALLNFMQCLEYAEQLESDADQAFALQQMTVVAIQLNDDRAYEWAKKSHTMALTAKVEQLYIPVKITLAKTIADEEPSESIKLLKEARILSEEFNATQFIDEIEIVEKQLANNQAQQKK
jgi:tetratricopeptide (TPR) repeat protein